MTSGRSSAAPRSGGGRSGRAGWLVAIVLALFAGAWWGQRAGERDRRLAAGVESVLADTGAEAEATVTWGHVTLRGTVPSREVRLKMLSQVGALEGVRQIADRTDLVPPRQRRPSLLLVLLPEGGATAEGLLATGEAPAWGEALTALEPLRFVDLQRRGDVGPLVSPEAVIGPLTGISEGADIEIEVAPGRLRARGTVTQESDRRALAEGWRSTLGSDWELDLAIEVPAPRPEAAGWEARLAELLGARGIRFRPGTAELTAEDEAALDRVAAFLREHPGLSVEIAASGDPGAPAFGKRRADSVYMALRRREIPSLAFSRRALDAVPEQGGLVVLRIRR